MAATALSDGVETRILDAALQCIGRRGIVKLTLDEVARQAGCGRATVYRTFPLGKRGVIEGAAAHELQRFLTAVEPSLEAADTLEDLVVAGLTGAARFAATSDALVYLAAHEPELILTHVAFDRVDVVFAAAERFLRPHLERFVDRSDVPAVSEWVTRVALLYVCLPYAPLDLTDEGAARHLVGTYLLPGLTSIPAPNPQLRS